MKPIVRNILAVLAGFVVGSAINMGLILVGHQVIAPPDGADLSTMEGLKAAMPMFTPQHFIFPFLAHAIGTLAGAATAAAVAVSHKRAFALGIGALFLAGGVTNVFLLPAPMWFNALDLVVAYLPMGYLGGRLAAGREQGAPG